MSAHSSYLHDGKTYKFPPGTTHAEAIEYLNSKSTTTTAPAPPAIPSTPYRQSTLPGGGDAYSQEAANAGIERPDQPDSRAAAANAARPLWKRVLGIGAQDEYPDKRPDDPHDAGPWAKTVGPTALDIGEGIGDIGEGHIARGGHKLLRAGGTVALPLVGKGISSAPGATLRALVAAYAGDRIAHSGAELLGANKDQADFSGDLGGLVGGGLGAKAPELIKPPIRGAGRLLQAVSGASDLPTNIPMSPKVNALMKAANFGKSKVGGLGRKMANVGIPQAPDVMPWESTAPEPPDFTVRPDAQSHYNDISPTEPEPESAPTPQGGKGRIPIWQQASELQSHIDSAVDSVPKTAPVSASASEPTIIQAKPGAVKNGKLVMHSSYATAPPEPTGWPENGRENEPWDAILDRDRRNQELPHALKTDPYNLVDEIQAGQPRRRSTDPINPGRGEIIEPDAFDDYDEKDIFRPDYKSNIKDTVEGVMPKGELPSSPPPESLSDTVGSQSGADADTAAFSQARQELPNGTLSDHLQRAQQIKLQSQGQK